AAMSTSFDRRAIMTKAWREYRFQTAWRDDKRFDRTLFTEMLRDQWAIAKVDAQRAVEAAAEAARLAVASPAERRIAEIKGELSAMQYRNFIPWARHDALTAELAGLSRR